MQKLLGIPDGENRTDSARELQEQVSVYLKETASRYNVDHITKVSARLCLNSSCRHFSICGSVVGLVGIWFCFQHENRVHQASRWA